MPVYANFFYIPEKKGFLPENEEILKLVDSLLEDRVVELERSGPVRIRGRKAGLFTRLKVMVLGEMQKKEEEGPQEEPPVTAIYPDPSSEERIDIADREALAEHPALNGPQNDYVRIELPYLAGEFVEEKIGHKAEFERGITITRSPEYLPVMDAYENIQAGCRFCKAFVFDPRDHMVSRTKVKCPQCEAEMDLHGLKITPPIPFAKFLVGFEQSKVSDPEDDPKNSGLDLCDFKERLRPVFGVRFECELIYT